MRGTVLETDDLMELLGYDRPGDVTRCLRKQGIKVFQGRKGPWTTLELINAAGGVTPGGANTQNSGYDPDIVV